MGQYMEEHEDVLTETNEEGLQKALDPDKNYAFLMESSSIQYYTERYCTLEQVADPIDEKDYGIGMRHGEFGRKNKFIIAIAAGNNNNI